MLDPATPETGTHPAQAVADGGELGEDPGVVHGRRVAPNGDVTMTVKTLTAVLMTMAVGCTEDPGNPEPIRIDGEYTVTWTPVGSAPAMPFTTARIAYPRESETERIMSLSGGGGAPQASSCALTVEGGAECISCGGFVDLDGAFICATEEGADGTAFRGATEWVVELR